MVGLKNIFRILHTIRHLRPGQIGFRLWYRSRRPAIDLRPAPAVRPVVANWVAPVGKPTTMTAANRFRFLNEEHAVSVAADWNHPNLPKLWLYNRHYFDDLTAADAADAADRHHWHLDLIRRWIAENPPGAGNGWEPYPASLRIVNWIKWALAGNQLPPEAVHSLAVQARCLRKRLEYHLLGNHLFANAKALVFAGLYFQGREAEKWLRKGLAILAAEIPEQILPDGGHFERSPMYHSIILEDLLDLVNLFQAYGRMPTMDLLDAGVRMRVWLQVLTHPDGRIALFNDAAFGIAPEVEALDAYAGRLGLGRWDNRKRPVTWWPETGYVRCELGSAVLLLDAAPVGPDYIPGHAHADTLNFELSFSGRRIIVDSGVSTYEKNSERQRQRGTAAHNTVVIDDEDSSEVWGGFRVARRARPFDLKIKKNNGEILVSCAHDGYCRLPGKPVHRRQWALSEKGLQVRDSIEGGFKSAVARYHFHPDMEVEMTGAGTGKMKLPGGHEISFRITHGLGWLEEATYHPEFNVSLANRCLVVEFTGAEVELSFVWVTGE